MSLSLLSTIIMTTNNHNNNNNNFIIISLELMNMANQYTKHDGRATQPMMIHGNPLIMLPQQDMLTGMNDYNDKNHYFTTMDMETTETTTTTT